MSDTETALLPGSPEALSALRRDPPVAYHLEPEDEVGCYYCQLENNHTTYRRGEAYLCDAGHRPYDGNANYICQFHLDPEALIVELPVRITSRLVYFKGKRKPRGVVMPWHIADGERIAPRRKKRWLAFCGRFYEEQVVRKAPPETWIPDERDVCVFCLRKYQERYRIENQADIAVQEGTADE